MKMHKIIKTAQISQEAHIDGFASFFHTHINVSGFYSRGGQMFSAIILEMGVGMQLLS